jgi:hypothetical protein
MSEPALREEGWYAVMIGDGLACLYWTGAAWQIPRSVHLRKKLPETAIAAARPIAWRDEGEFSAVSPAAS